MTSCKCLNPRFASSRRLAYSWTPSVHCPTRQTILHHTVCGSKARAKQTKDTSVSVQGGGDSDFPQGEQSGGDQSKGGEELSRSGKPKGWKVLPREDSPQPPVQQKEQLVIEYGVASASRSQVFWACTSTSAVLSGFALVLRARAPVISTAALFTDPAAVERLVQWPHQLDAGHAAVAVLCAAAVTAARVQLLQRWPAFAEASERSLSQVMPQLGPLDIVWLAILPGFSEELLFRGALIPSLYPDWRGVIISGVVFGLLHNSGGRNLAFAWWASLVGILYGGAFLYTQDIFVPMMSHSLANAAAIILWRQSQKE